MTYVIGVSSGIFQAIPEAERFQYAGLPRKAQFCITKGVEFVQIDLESVAEFKDPELKSGMEKVKSLGITFGIHSETRAFGVEVAELDSAIETDYKFGHERLIEILEKSGSIESKYVLVHSSESEPFLLLERHLQPASLVDFFGRPYRKFLEENKELVDWLMGGKIEENVEGVFKKWKEKGKKITDENIREVIKSQDFIWREIIGVTLPEAIRRRTIDMMEHFEITTRIDTSDLTKLTPDALKDLERLVKMTITTSLGDYRRAFLDYVQSRGLHYGPERIAYFLLAKWMELRKDYLWENIVNANLEYFAKIDGKTKEEWLTSKDIEKLSVDNENFRKYNYLWVAAISTKYIWGHLNQDKNPDKLYSDLKPILKKNKMFLVLETPMAHRGIEEWLRLPNPIQMYYLVKNVNEEAGFECLSIAMDFEHMISIRLEPEKVIEVLPEDGGKFVRVIHAGWPAPLAPAHIPIPLGSEQQTYLYRMLFALRQKGFGKDPKVDYYIVFERGGGADPIQQSVIALREIVKNLEKDVAPEKLPMEFFGVESTGFLSPQRQEAIIREHVREPLKGLLAVPEEEYTTLGTAAIGKGKRPEEWKKEELR